MNYELRTILRILLINKYIDDFNRFCFRPFLGFNLHSTFITKLFTVLSSVMCRIYRFIFRLDKFLYILLAFPTAMLGSAV